jgi:hypothetical protein
VFGESGYPEVLQPVLGKAKVARGLDQGRQLAGAIFRDVAAAAPVPISASWPSSPSFFAKPYFLPAPALVCTMAQTVSTLIPCI